MRNHLKHFDFITYIKTLDYLTRARKALKDVNDEENHLM